jgi:NAD(P)-dependent dehydrogenase (short-subunit alcohol dehydrogenase family)
VSAPSRPSGLHSGKVAVVTGSAGGLGRAYAERLAREGATVVVADIESGSDTVDAIARTGGRAFAVECDVSSEPAVAQLRDATLSHCGRCDILVNNAGLAPHVAWDELDLATWRRVMEVNLDGMFLTCKAYSPVMRQQRFGRIINVSSNLFGIALPGWVAYVASKAGVIGLTRALATDLGEDGITVNAVLPGLTRTPATEASLEGTAVFEHHAGSQAIKRNGIPADLEGVVSFLATDEAGWMTAQTLVVDGGLLRH